MGRKKLSKSVFGYFKTLKKKIKQKVPMAIKLEGGGGKALVARPRVDELFLRLPLISEKKISGFGNFLGQRRGGVGAVFVTWPLLKCKKIPFIFIFYFINLLF